MDPITVPIAVDAVASTLLHDLIQLGIALFTAIVAALGAYKAIQVGAQNKEQQKSITRLELTVDGRLTELLEIHKKASFAAGQKAEAAEGVVRSDAAVAATAKEELAKAVGAAEEKANPTVTAPAQASKAEIVTEVVSATDGQELVISAEHAKVETDKSPAAGEGDLIIKADGAKIRSEGKS